MALTPKQDMFIKEYLIDLNATQAAIRAGYSPDTAYSIGQENLKKPEIKEALDKAKQERQDLLDLDAYWVLRRFKDISDRCMQATPVMFFNRITKEWENTGEYEFDSAGANKATEMIAKHLRICPDTNEHTGPNGGPILYKDDRTAAMSAEELKAAVLELIAQDKPELDKLPEAE